MKEITLSKFLKKYRPTAPPNIKTEDQDSLEYFSWNMIDHEEYIKNKSSAYVWTIVQDPNKGLIAIPYKDMFEGNSFLIATERNNQDEYVKLPLTLKTR